MYVYNLKVCHPSCVRSLIQGIYCVYIYICIVKNTTICQIVAICNIQLHVVVYYILLLSDKLLCFGLYVYVNIYTIYTLYYVRLFVRCVSLTWLMWSWFIHRKIVVA
jgi:hypothetical protein